MSRRCRPTFNAAALTLALGLAPATWGQSGNPFDDAGGPPAAGNPFDSGPASGGPARAVNSAGPAAAVRFREHKFTDPGLHNMVAMTILAPSDWKMEGELMRLPVQYYNSPLAFDVKFTAPDGRQARFLPSMSFEFGSPQNNQRFQKLSPTQSGNLFYPLPESPGSWIAELARDYPAPGVTNFRVVSEQMIPDLTQKLRQQNASVYQMIQQINLQDQQMRAQFGGGFSYQVSFDTQATKVEVAYEENGRRFRETILINWAVYANYLNGQLNGGNWSVIEMRSARGPEGHDHLNDPQIMAVFQSARANPRWTAEMQRYWQKLAEIRNKGARDRQASWQKHNAKMQQIRNETTEIINSGWSERQAIQERGAERFRDVIMDEQAYRLPDGEKVKLPSFYDNAYTNGNGEYILSNDPSFSPVNNPQFNGNWQELPQIR
jgi:hypothetical protein